MSIEALQKKLDSHAAEFSSHCQDDLDRWDKMIDVQERNTASIEELTASTKGLIEAWTATQGAIKLGAAFSKFIQWAVSVAVVGSGVSWLLNRFS